MPHALVSALGVMLVSGACAVLAGCGEHGGTAPVKRAVAPPAERPLLGRPDLAGPTTRGIFLKDPKGQVEEIAAGGHLVAWTVQSPADELRDGFDDASSEQPPKRLPSSTKIVIADERGGTPITVSLDHRWVSKLRMIRGPGGPAEPQLAVESCTARAHSTCHAELLTLTPAAPLKITARTGGPGAAAAVDGFLDSGRRLDVTPRGKRPSCAAPLSVRETKGDPARALPPLPTRDGTYTRCTGLSNRQIFGHYAFASVMRTAPGHDFDAEFVYGIDIAAGPSARWREVYRPYRYTPGSVGFAVGPALTDRALYWEETDEETESMYWLQQVTLPRDEQHDRSVDASAEPIAPDAKNTCTIEATDAAIYELINPRCTIWYGERAGGEIRRVVNPFPG
jgi:hypothetical protein